MTLPILSDADSRALTRRIGGLSIAVAMGVGAVAYGFGFGVGGRSTPVAAGTAGAAAAETWFAEEWDYTSTANMKSDPNGWMTFQFEKTDTVEMYFTDTLASTPWGGTDGIRVKYFGLDALPDTMQDAESSVTLDFPTSDTENEIWWETWVRWDSNFRTDFGYGLTPDHKTIFVFPETGAAGLRREIKVGTQNDSTIYNQISSSTYREAWRVPPEGSFSPWPNAFDAGSVNAKDDLYDFAWHHIRVHMVMDTDGTDGVWEVWLDGTLVAQEEAGDLRGSAQGNTGWGSIKFPNNINEQPTSDQSIWFGPLRVYISDPGWS